MTFFDRTMTMRRACAFLCLYLLTLDFARPLLAEDPEPDTTPPVFVSVLPQDGSLVSAAQVTLEGDVTGADALTVDGQPATLVGGHFVAGPYTLSEGARTWSLRATDAAGNETTRTHRLVRDSTPPVLTVSQPQQGAVRGASPIAVVGTVTDTHAVTVTVNGTSATLTGTTWVVPNVPLAEGETLLSVEARDAAGNVTGATRTVVLDTLPPAVAITDPAPGTVVPGTTIAVSGSVADPHLDRVEVNGVRATVSNGTWTASVPLSEGSNDLVARAWDTLSWNAADTVSVLRDSQAPAIQIGLPEEGSWWSATTVAVSGTVEEETGLTVTVNGGAATLTGGSFAVSGVALTEGENRLVARVVDHLGNQGAHTRIVYRDTVAPRFVASAPASGALALPLEASISLTFSEELRTPLAAGSWRLETASGQALAAVATVSGETVTIQPQSLLPSRTGLRLVLTAGLVDRAGNALAEPPVLTFTTDDREAPAPPVLSQAPVGFVCGPRLALSGTAEADAVIEVTGGAGVATTGAGENGAFALAVDLRPETLNRLEIVARDRDGNRSAPLAVEVVHDCTGPQVTGAALSGTVITVSFSERIKPTTLTGQVQVATAGGPLTGILAATAGEAAATFTLASVPAEPLRLTVGTGVQDRAGNGLAYPYSQRFGTNPTGTPSFLAGRVIDNETGRPLVGAAVTVVASNGAVTPEPQPEQTTAADGRFRLPAAQGTHLVLTARNGYTPALRITSVAAGQGADVFDPRLTPAAAPVTLPASGGTFDGEDGLSLTIPSGALAASASVAVTALEEQGLPALLPYGWSPRGAAWVDLGGAGLSDPATLALPVDAPNGTTLALVRLNLATLQWNVVEVAQVAADQVSIPVDAEGGWAAVEADTGAGAPPAPVAGAILGSAVAASSEALTAAALEFDPATVLPSQRSLGTVTYTVTPGSELPSGIPLTLEIQEELTLLDNSVRRPGAYEADLVAYRAPAGGLRSRFGLRPSVEAQSSPLRIGSEAVAIHRYADETVRGNVLGPQGGSVVSTAGDQVTVPVGGLLEPTAVTLTRRADTNLPRLVPANTSFLGLLELDLSGRTLAGPAQLTLELGAVPEAGAGLLFQSVDLGNGPAWRPVAALVSTATGWTTAAIDLNDPEALPWPGVREGAVYLFAKLTTPVGYVRGTVFDVGGSPLAGAVISSGSLDWLQISGGGDLNGRYVLPAPQGAHNLLAENRATGNVATIALTMPENLPRIELDLYLHVAGPRVVTVTPVNGSTNVLTGIEPTITFSEPVDPSTVAAGILLYDGPTVVPVGLQVQGTLVRVNPHPTLRPGATHELKVNTAVRDLQGNRLEEAVTSTFVTLQPQLSNQFDLTRIHLLEPVNGVARVVGRPGAVPANLTVIVDRTTGSASSVTGTAGQDGSFELSIPATLADTILLHVVRPGQSEIIIELTPFLTADGSAAYVDAGVPVTFTTLDGITVAIETGTFLEPAVVRVAPVEDLASIKAPIPADVPVVFAFDLDFGGIEAQKPLQITLPTPAGVTKDELLLSRIYTILGRDYWMLYDLMRRNGGVITTALLPDEITAALGGPQAVARLASLAPPPNDPHLLAATSRTQRKGYLPGAANPGRYVVMENTTFLDFVAFPFLAGQQAFFLQLGLDGCVAAINQSIERLLGYDAVLMPTRRGLPFSIVGRSLSTGFKIFEKTFSPPTGQFTELPRDIYGDDTPPMPVAGSPVRFFPIVPASSQTVELDRGFNMEVEIPPGSGQGVLRLTGAPGTAQKDVQIRVKGLDDSLDTSVRTAADGSFSFQVNITSGHRYIVAIGAIVSGDESLEIEFSEGLPDSFPGIDILDANGKSLRPRREPVGSNEKVRITPAYGWIQGTYTLRLGSDLSDATGNTWNKTLDVEIKVRLSQPLDTYALPAARDMARLGSLLFVAADSKGLVVLDASDPADLKNYLPDDLAFPFPLNDPVMGVAVDPHGRVLVAGGGLNGFGQLKIFDPLALDLEEIAGDPSARFDALRGSTLVSDKLGTDTGTSLPEGRPMQVTVLSGDKRDRWRIGIDPPPAGVELTFAPVPGTTESVAVASGSDGKSGLPVTFRNLTLGRWNRVDAIFAGEYDVQVRVRVGDEVELLRNEKSVAYLSTSGAGIQVVDVNAFYNEDTGNPDPAFIGSDLLGTYSGGDDPTLALCGQAVADIGAALVGLGTLFDLNNTAHPLTLVGLVGLRGLALFDSKPESLGDISFFHEMCLNLNGSAQVSGLAIAEDYPFDLDKDGTVEPDEYHDYVLVAHRTQGVLIFDAQDRDELVLVGWIQLSGGQAARISVDRDRRRLYVSGYGGGIYVLDFDRLPSTQPIDLNQDTRDDRLLETISLGGNTNAPVFLMPELGLAYAGGLDRGVTSIAVGGPRLTTIAEERTPAVFLPGRKPWREIQRVAPLGVPINPGIGPSVPYPSFRVLAFLPGVAGDEARLDVVSLGPGGLPIAGAGDPAAISGLPAASLEGPEKGVRLRRLAQNPWEEGYQLYLSEEVVALADLRASRDYQGLPVEKASQKLCRRCWAEKEGISTEAREILSGHQIAVRLSEDLRTALAGTYSTDRLDAAGAFLASIPWDLSPALHQEPGVNPSTGSGEVVPGTLLHSGEMTLTATDLFLKGAGVDFAFTRTYRNQAMGAGPLGPGWDHVYNVRLRELPTGDIDYFDGRGRRDFFKKVGEGIYETPSESFVALHRTSAGWVMIDPQHNLFRFDRFGRLIAAANAAKDGPGNGTELEMTYDLRSRLVRVSAHGRYIAFGYDEAGHLTDVRDFTGREVHYEYDPQGRLTSVRSPRIETGLAQYPAGLTTTYGYAAPAGDLAGQLSSRDDLTSVTDPKGYRSLDLTYTDADGDGRSQEVTTQVWGGATISIAYQTGTRQASVTDRRSKVWQYRHDEGGHPVQVTNPLGHTLAREYETTGALIEETLPGGRKIIHKPRSDPEDARARATLSFQKVIPDSRGSNGSFSELTTEFLQYDSRTNTPTRVRDPRGVVTRTDTNDRGLPVLVVAAETSDAEGSTSTEYNDLGLPVRVTNPNGHIIRLEYYEEAPFKGFLKTSTVDPGGLDLKTTYEWDPRGYAKTVTDPRGVRHEYVYNEMGWLVEERAGVSGSDGVPLVRRYSYDRNGNVEEVHASAGDGGESFTRTQNVYGDLNQLLEARSEATPGAGDFSTTHYEYDAVLNRTSETGPDGQVSEWAYDARNLPVTAKRGVGQAYESTETFAYDADGQLTSHTDGEGKVWQTAYDGYGRVAEEIDPLGNSRKTVYDSNSNVTEVYHYASGDTLLSRAEMVYDDRNRLVTETHFLWDPEDGESEPRPLTRSYVYDAASNPKIIRDERSLETRIEYDNAERKSAVQDALGNRIALTLDGQGNTIRTVETQLLPGGGSMLSETSRTFNPMGLPVRVVDPAGRTTQWVRDVRGNVRLTIDGAGLTMENVYDGLDRLVRTTQPDGTFQAFTYDASSRLVSYADSLNQQTQYVYDQKNRLLEIEYPDESKETFSYDNRDLRLGWVRPNGTQIAETYDDAGRLLSRQVVVAGGTEGPASESFVSDGLGRVTQATSGSVVTQRRYDSLSRLISETQGSRVIRYAYDDASNRTRIEYPSGQVIEVQPDNLGRVAAIEKVVGAGTRTSKATYGYRGADLIASKTLGAAISGTLQYDASGLLLQSTISAASGRPVFAEKVAWNARALKSVQSRGDLNGSALHFTYDGAGRLTQAERRSGESTTALASTLLNLPDSYGFTYDKANNLLAKTQDRLCDDNQVDLPLDGSGRNRPGQVGGTALLWNANGGLERKGDRNFHYDWKDRLVRVTPANGGAEIARYTYDAFDRRVAKNVSGEQIETVWDGWQAIEEYRTAQLTSRRVYGLGLDEIVSLEIDFDGDGTLTEYLPLYDETGNLVAVTDTQGKVVERYEYSPYGDRAVFVDSTPPSIEQVRVRGNEVWIELSEEALLAPLTEAVSQGTLTLEIAETGADLPMAVLQPVQPGSSGHRRLIVKLTSPPETWPSAGTLLRLTVPSAALRDAFDNAASAGTVQSFAWAGGDLLLQDGVAPRVERVCVTGGKLEIELSEEPKLADLDTIIQLNGAPVAWTLSEDRYTLLGPSIQPGTYELTIGTQPLDLADLGLAEAFQKSFTLNAGETRTLVYQAALPGFLAASTIGNPFGFHGLPVDPETGLIYARHRYYDPELGRFISPDPMGYADGPNLYQYGLNSPVNYTDPTGEIALVDNLIGGAIGVATGWAITCVLGSCSDYTLQDAAIDFGLGFVTSGLSALGGIRHLGQGVSGAMRFAGRAGLEVSLGMGAEYVRSTIKGEEVTAGQLFKGALLNFGIGEAGSFAGPKLARYAREGVENLLGSGSARNVRSLHEAAAAVSPGQVAQEAGSITRAEIMRALRKANTPEAHATAKLLKRGPVRLEIVNEIPKDVRVHPSAAAYYVIGTNRVGIVAPKILGGPLSAEGYVGHEVYHWLQNRAGIQVKSKLSELEAFLWQRAIDPKVAGRDALLRLVNEHDAYRNSPPFGYK